jgi:hypothetical protein
MTRINRWIFTLGITLLLTPLASADMGPGQSKPRVASEAAAKPRVIPRRHHYPHTYHPSTLCRLNCCELKVDQDEIDRSYNLQVSGELTVDWLFYEHYRQEALEWAVEMRKDAARACLACPEEAVGFIWCARYMEYNWRHIDAVDFVPCDPCGEDLYLMRNFDPCHCFGYNG